MSRALTATLLVVFCCPPLFADDKDPAPVVILPDNPTPPPPPVPTPPSSQTLPADQLYIIRASVPCTIVASPADFLKITTIASPSTIRAKFIDGDGTYQTKTFSDKFIYTVEAIGTGKSELIIVANGTVTRRCINAVNGPLPPPTPPTPTDPLTKALQAGYDLDKDADKAASLAFLQQVYAGMVGLAPTWTAVKTNADALAQIKTIVTAPGAGLTATQVVNLRKAIGANFAAKFGTTATTPIDLTALAAEFGKVAAGLKGVK